MKVCTDSCLFGAWVADKVEKKYIDPKNILDIGSGTGLLSLMLAQKTNALIDAVEIDQNSFEQTRENFDSSPWQNQLKVFHADIKKWHPPGKYELIISNPPFFENDLLPVSSGKENSKHSNKLSLNELLLVVKYLLSENGHFAVLLPFNRTQWFENTAPGYSLYPLQKLEVRQTVHHNFFRTFLLFQQRKLPVGKQSISIKNEYNEYTEACRQLLKDYYLFL